MSRETDAADLLHQARQLFTSAGPRDQVARSAANSQAQHAQRMLRPARSRAGRLLAAEAEELRSSIHFAEGDLELAIGGMIAAASSYVEIGSGDDSHRGLARVARTLAAIYFSVGMRDRAAQFALEYLTTIPRADRDLLAMAYSVSALAASGRPEQLAIFTQEKPPAEYPEPLRSILIILAQRAGQQDYRSEELAGATRMLTYVPSDLRLQCTLFAANGLIRQGEGALAVDVLSQLRAGLAADPVTDARVVQAIGAAAVRAGDADASLRHYLLAWTRYDDLRYRVGSMSIRRAIDSELVRSRSGALAAAVSRADWRQLLELIESCRLQATFDMPGSAAEMDQVLATGAYEKPSSTAERVVDVDRLPGVFRAAAEDLLGGRADVAGQCDIYVGGVSSLAEARAADGVTRARQRLDAERVMQRHSQPEDLWWSNWCENGVLYWVLARGGLLVDAGAVSLVSDEALCQALSVVSLRYNIDPPWPVPAAVADVDLTRFLATADSFEELQLTGALARVLPPAVLTPGEPSRRLFISNAAELAPIPWPILPLNPEANPVTRLVEHFELHFLPSLSILERVRGKTVTDTDTELPFLLACDYCPTPGGPSPLPSRRAQTILAAREQCDGTSGLYEATAMNVLRFLRALPRGTEGVAFFRAHFEWADADPGSSGIVLADEALPSGLLGAQDPTTGETVLNLPSTVVMSCCSTSGSRERNGGETLGLAPLAMLAGARRLIVTSVEIQHTSFTVALDDMLIDLAVRRADHFAALHTLQLRLLDQWRQYSSHDVGTWRDITPTPDIWSHYQAFGA